MSQECDPVTGQCPCRAHFHGLSCQLCSKGYWKPSLSGQCQPCNCDPTRSYGDTCDQVGLLLSSSTSVLAAKQWVWLSLVGRKISNLSVILRVIQVVFIKGGIIMTSVTPCECEPNTQSNLSITAHTPLKCKCDCLFSRFFPPFHQIHSEMRTLDCDCDYWLFVILLSVVH